MPSLAEGEFVPSDPMEALVALANTSDVYVWVAMIVSIGALVGAIAGPVFGALQMAPEAGGATVVAEAVWGDSLVGPLLRRWAVASAATALVTSACLAAGAVVAVVLTLGPPEPSNIVIMAWPPTTGDLVLGFAACLASALAHTGIALVVAAGWGPVAGFGVSAGLYVATLSLRQVPGTDALVSVLPGAKELGWLDGVTGSRFSAVDLIIPLGCWLLAAMVLVLMAKRRWAPATASHGRLAGIEAGTVSLGSGRRGLSVADVHMPAGTTMVVVGPTGAGKTTLLRLLTGQRRLERGTRTRRTGSRQSWIESDGLLAPNVCVRRAIATTVGAVAGTRVEGAQLEHEAAALGIADLLDKRPSALSHGERQLSLLLAHVLMEPDVLVLDEALDAVDAERRHQIVAGLVRRRPAHASMIVASHASGLVPVADQVVVVDRGVVSVHPPDGLRRVLVVRQLDGALATVPLSGPTAEDLSRAAALVPAGATVVALDLALDLLRAPVTSPAARRPDPIDD
jgi:ABC-type multidrug transport system ATPase subunit